MATQTTPTDGDATPAENGSRRKFVLPILIVIVLFGLGWAVKEYMYARGHESTDDAQVNGNMTPVLVKVGGYVQRLTVDENEHVAADSLLVQIDPSEYQARLAQAEADLAAARAAVSGPQGEGQAQAAVQAASNQRGSLEAQIGAAQANLTKANADLVRAKELVAKQIVSKQQLDAAQAAADATAAQLRALEKQQSAASSNISAARAGVRPSLAEPALYHRVNAEGTINLLEAGRKTGVKKFTIASSSSVYGLNTKVPFSESDLVVSQISPYAASKLACETIGHVYHHIHGLDIAMLRFFTVYGPRQRPDLAIYKFARLITTGQPIPVFGDGSTARDYTFITDTLDGIIACTRQEFGFEIFNLGESQTVPLSRLIELLEAALGRKAIIDRQPLQPGDVPITYADITKARARLGYNPQVPIELGIKLFADWFQKSQASAS